MLERVSDLPGAAMKKPFVAYGCPVDQLTLAPHQQIQADASTAAVELGFASAADRPFAAAVSSVCEDLHMVLASLNISLDETPHQSSSPRTG